MKARTYYGEYSLKHWIDLMLNANIVLPEYQRSFVWDEKKLKRLIISLQNNQYVPPITLARLVSPNGESKNLILDGQQRLTSILLAYLGLFPNYEKFKKNNNEVPSEDDSALDESDVQKIKSIQWTFQDMLSDSYRENTKDAIRARLLPKGTYLSQDYIDKAKLDTFLKTTYLGFSYIVPNTKDQEEIRKMFSLLFRNVNYYGKRLSDLESRRSLYYMNDTYKNFFDGVSEEGKDVLCGIGIKDHLQSTKLDMLRFVSILSQYTSAPNHNINKVLRGYAAYSSRESYYADYVSYVLGMDQESYENKFDDFKFEIVFPSHCWKERYTKLLQYITVLRPYMNLKEGKDFSSWIDADYWLFGLIYKVVFCDDTIEDIEKLHRVLSEKIRAKRENPIYSKTPNRLGYLRERITESISIYESC